MPITDGTLTVSRELFKFSKTKNIIICPGCSHPAETLLREIDIENLPGRNNTPSVTLSGYTGIYLQKISCGMNIIPVRFRACRFKSFHPNCSTGSSFIRSAQLRCVMHTLQQPAGSSGLAKPYVSPDANCCADSYSVLRIATFDDCGMIDEHFRLANIGSKSGKAACATLRDIEIMSCCSSIAIYEQLYEAGKKVEICSAALSSGCQTIYIDINNKFLNKLSTDKENEKCQSITLFETSSAFSIDGTWTGLNEIKFYAKYLKVTELDFSNAVFRKQQIQITFRHSFPHKITLPETVQETGHGCMELFFDKESHWYSPMLISASNQYPLTINVDGALFEVNYYKYGDKFYVLPIGAKIDGNYPELAKEIIDETEFILDPKYFAKRA
jgi:hypothetical protein